MDSVKEWLQSGTVGALTAIVLWLLGKRGANQVKNDNARADRQSRFEENLQAQYAAALQRIDELEQERDGFKARLLEADKRLTVVQMIADGDPTRAVEISRDSAFVDLSRPLRPRPPPRPAGPPMDPFQAADPYAPPPVRKPPRR